MQNTSESVREALRAVFFRAAGGVTDMADKEIDEVISIFSAGDTSIAYWNQRALNSPNPDVWYRCHRMIGDALTAQIPPQANDKELEAQIIKVVRPYVSNDFQEDRAVDEIVDLIHKDRAAVQEKTIMDFNSRIVAAQERAEHYRLEGALWIVKQLLEQSAHDKGALLHAKKQIIERLASHQKEKE